MDLGVAGLEDVVEVGRGGFATVYRAYQPAFRRTVAVKVLNATDLDELSAERFRRECQAMGLLSEHPSIVTILDAGFLDTGQAYMVMPFMPAGSLGDRVRRDGPLPWAEASKVAVKLAGALHAAHDAGVIHRDVKPANVLISEYGEAMLADFGIARVSGASETASGVITASLAYAPPEVIEGKRPTVRSDIYSLGATVYDLLAGHSPFEVGAETSVAAILNRILNQEPVDLASRGVPAAMAEVIAKAMAKDPEARFDTAATFGRHVRLVQDELGIRPTELTILKVEAQPPAAKSDADPDQATAAGTGAEAEPETIGVTAAGITPTSAPAADSPVDHDDATRDVPIASASGGDAAPDATGALRGSVSDEGSTKPRRNLLVVAAIAAVVVIIGLVLALSGGGSSDEPTDTASGDQTGGGTTAQDSEGDSGSAQSPDSAPSEPGTGPTAELPILDDLCPDGLDSTVPDPGADLQGSTLSCFDWSDADLSNVNFYQSRLIGIDMTGANLAGASLGDATLSGVDLTNASLQRTILGGGGFEGIDLHGLDWASADISEFGEGLTFTNVSAVDFDFTEHFGDALMAFTSSDLTGANLSGLKIQGFTNSTAARAILDGATGFEGGAISGANSNFDGASARNVEWSTSSEGAGLENSSFVGADLTGANLRGALLHRADLTDAITDGADFTDADWSETTCPDGSSSNENLGSCDL